MTATAHIPGAAMKIVLFSPGLDEQSVWGEKILVTGQAASLRNEFPGAEVFTFGLGDIDKIAAMRVDLLISYYTGPRPPWRADDIADLVDGITILTVWNHGDLLEEFARIRVDGFATNSKSATQILGRHRPTLYLPTAIADDYGPFEPDPRYRADVVYLGGGGRGNKRPETTRRYLEPAMKFDFALWGSHWEREYWAGVYADNPDANRWHRFWRGRLPLDDIARLYSSAKIVLNYHEDSQREWGMWNNRVFEALGCGALMICDEALGLREEFGDAIVYTSGGPETEELIAYYLAHPEERRRRGALGRRIVDQKYTFSRGARTLREFYQRLARDRQLASDANGNRGGNGSLADGRALAAPRFTVMIPVYDRVLGLRDAIESVLNQSCPDFELILADDGSTRPEVAATIDAYRAEPRMRVLRMAHRGQGAALNSAARVARGTYLCRLDSDDLLVPEALEVMNQYVERYPEVSYFYSSRFVIDEDGEILESHHKTRPFDPARLLEAYSTNPFLCWKRDDFLAVDGFREHIRFAEDYDLALRMACRFKFRNVDEFLYKIRYHSANRITTTLSEEERRREEDQVRATSGAALREKLTSSGSINRG
jgi:glycosyltransferase involved in cell wall biosynthesis